MPDGIDEYVTMVAFECDPGLYCNVPMVYFKHGDKAVLIPVLLKQWPIKSL